jgi:hypothetical protein
MRCSETSFGSETSRPSRHRRTGRATTADSPLRGTRSRTKTLSSPDRSGRPSRCSSHNGVPASSSSQTRTVWRGFAPRSLARAQLPTTCVLPGLAQDPPQSGLSACPETRKSGRLPATLRLLTKPPPAQSPRPRRLQPKRESRNAMERLVVGDCGAHTGTWEHLQSPIQPHRPRFRLCDSKCERSASALG